MNLHISITAISSISSLGASLQETWKNYQTNNHFLVPRTFNGKKVFVSELSKSVENKVGELKASDTKYKSLDNSVLYAILVSRHAMGQAGWDDGNNIGINIGSSRGATSLFEKYHKIFLQDKNAPTLTSPTTTLGNISSWVAHDLQTSGPDISHSITCSTALHALLNGVAWLKGGMADKFLVGGSEAPLTPFTIAQMQALKVYAKFDESVTGQTGIAYGQRYPCLALDLNKSQNTMVLGEGASVACLEKGVSKNALAVIEGIGYATEPLEHNVSISTDAQCFQRSMKMALGTIDPAEIDVIVMHAPGTVKGDAAEYAAIKKVFCNKLPFLTTNKWKVGHTFGASGMLSVELAILMLQHQQPVKVPFLTYDHIPDKIRKIVVNAVGFGGNAVSVLLSKVG
ncbi:beta-ketoacyl synthase N-terminal-like domain-containing protein [Costertonia aggregata]|uniref:Beta-ketoacyl synthase n=1 Tax=Costertonia aggregata TaxID=343403 RepID=A0A7H9AQ90_9FLAO|nr:beta-ketoacyl synthase N-terminal-like domain-containing protein [Costertonia aggregata]QLG45604.1 beta-ketoacyl synthase [Costertonia aggregata]